MAEKENTQAQKERNARQLRRLQTLIDVVFALLIFRLFSLLPHPIAPETGSFDPLMIFTEGGERFIMFIIGFVLVTIYWFQNNKTTGNLVSTDGKHAALSIIQLAFLLVYFYSVRLDIESKSDVLALLMQSVSLALVGFTGAATWVYASGRTELVSETITAEEANRIKISLLPEPIAATFTIPFAFIGPGIWNLSWLSVIVFGIILKRRQKEKFEKPN